MKVKATICCILIVLFSSGVGHSATRVFYSNTFDAPDSINDFVIFGEEFIVYDPPPPLHDVRVDSGQLLIETEYLQPNYPDTSPTFRGRAAVMMDTNNVSGVRVYNPILENNTGIVSWSINISNQDGGFNNQFSFVLLSTEEDPFDTSAQGYYFRGGVMVGGSQMGLWRFDFGLGGGQEILVDIVNGLGTLPDKGSFKITYDPGTNEWTVFGEIGSEYVNPENVNSLLGTAIDSTVTNVDAPYFGVVGRDTGQNFFDNLMISVDDVTPPSIISTNPDEGSVDVADIEAISINFSEQMNQTTINQTSIRVHDGLNYIEGEITCEGATVVFMPNEPIKCSETYTVTVNNSAEDLFGNALLENYLWSFTTNAPGQCGCGIKDTDSDGDGVLDCNDDCPLDEEKTAPGQCGCGIEDIDSDGDGVLDCIDDCPLDEEKTAPGQCGCGIEDIDSDGDGAMDCIDDCPLDKEKTEPGDCGCGSHEIDTDGDLINDCIDTDDDNDGIPDELDDLPLDSNESIDSDNDGIGNNSDLDDDGDSIPDSIEDFGPNGGDSNQDGIPDSLQGNIVSLICLDGINFITLELPIGKRFINCSIEDNPSPEDMPIGFSFPYGLMKFTISNVLPGETITVVINLPNNSQIDSYFKYGKTQDNQSDHWYEFLFDGQTGAAINNNMVTLFFQDSIRGDDVQVLDGMIIDIGGPSFIDNSNQDLPNAGGGCFLNSFFKD